jgi:hypothetical protein
VVKVFLRPIPRAPFRLAQMKLKGKYWSKNANNNTRIWQHTMTNNKNKMQNDSLYKGRCYGEEPSTPTMTLKCGTSYFFQTVIIKKIIQPYLLPLSLLLLTIH